MNKNEIILENRTARLTVMIDPNKKKALETLCIKLDTTPSQAIRQMIRNFLEQNNVEWSPSND